MSAPVPVDIPGFSYVRPLGAGGFADVLLYAQELPRRDVAVKILRTPVDHPGARARFEREAGAMAALSTHPSIVTIHHAAIAAGERAYLVMEYCSLPTLAAKCANRPLSVPEMLQTMVRLSGAVETAHRVGILHRDIKPANVLTTDYGWPALTDFGIAGIADDAEVDADSASIPWSAPEAVAGRGWDRRSDVYSLAATAYTLLAGASPFAAAPGATDVTSLIARVLRDPVPRIGRADVPASLEQLLEAALSKNPAERPQTASEFARGLQTIEQEMHLPVTHLDILSEEPPRTRRDARDAAAGAATEPDAESTFISASRPGGAAPADEATVLARRRTAPEDATVLSARSAPTANATADAAAGDDAGGEDATVLAARRAPEPADDATALATRPVSPPDQDEATRLVARAAAPAAPDATMLVPGRRSEGDDSGTEPQSTSVGAPASGRIAYSPGDSDVPNRVYGVRSAPLVTAPPQTAAPAASAPASAPPPTAPASSRRRRATATLWAVGIGALAVVGGAAAVLIALVTG